MKHEARGRASGESKRSRDARSGMRALCGPLSVAALLAHRVITRWLKRVGLKIGWKVKISVTPVPACSPNNSNKNSNKNGNSRDNNHHSNNDQRS